MSLAVQEQIQVLHVDDEPEFTDLTQTFLERNDDRFSIETAISADEGLHLINDRPPDCIVSDYNMSGMDGLEFLQAVRKEYPELPFILYTGKGSEAVASEAISTGVTDYLQKQSGSHQYELLANRIKKAVDQYRTEQELERQNDLFAKAQDIAMIGAWEHDPDSGDLVWTDQVYEMYGVSREFDPSVDSVLNLYHPDDRPKLREAIEQAATAGEAYDLEVRMTAGADGDRWFRIVADPQIEEDEVARVRGTVHDITDHKERVREFQRYEQLAEAVGDGLYVLDQGLHFQMVNDVMESLTGYSRDHLLGRPLSEVIETAETPVGRDAREQLLRSDRETQIVRADIQTADEETVPCEFQFSVLSTESGVTTAGVVRDITERKEQEQQLERKNRRLSVLFEQFPEPTLAYEYENGEPHIKQVNGAFTETFGYEAEEAVGTKIDSLLVPPDRQAEAAQIDDRVKTGDSVDEILQRQTKEGMRDFRFRNILLSDDDAIDGYAIYADVTERRQREQELERKEHIIQEMDDGVVVVQDQTITYTNPQISEIIGHPTEELLGEPMGKFMVPDDREKVRRRYEERLAGNEPPKTYEISLLRQDGDTVPVEITAGRVSYGGDTATLSIVRDIADRKERIRELKRQNERLEEFASIVSHDLRNPLNVASARLELAQDTCDSPHLANIAGAHARMERLIDDLLTLARQGETVREMDTISLRALVENCWAGVETAGTTLEVGANVTIRADRNRLRQAIENLIRNAVEHGGSDVTVRVGELADAPGFYVADDGPGIPEDTHDEIFESGYSTGEEGTGFGLAIVREIVEAHDWEISVTDSDDGGARFEITDIEIVE
ncbi:MAG: PAS domain S-box protein [Haloarculaceae archaeon]